MLFSCYIGYVCNLSNAFIIVPSLCQILICSDPMTKLQGQRCSKKTILLKNEYSNY